MSIPALHFDPTQNSPVSAEGVVGSQESLPPSQVADANVPGRVEPPPQAPFPLKRRRLLPVSLAFVKTDDARLNQATTKQGAIGFAVSFVLHAIALFALAFVLMSDKSAIDGLVIDGEIGTNNDLGEELIFDMGTTIDSGSSAPLELPDVTDVMQGIDVASSSADALRVGTGGEGNGQGQGGEDLGSGLGELKIPRHAQTKGSFSAWSDPRDPKPGEDYFIVIQIKLPEKYKKYKGSDLTGSVVGTDRYEQKIRYAGNQVFPVQDGNVQFRIRVPGGGRLVRDTIKIESKMLHEKQTFEIEF